MRLDLQPSIPNLPSLLPGETLYSWCGAVHMWNGNTSALQTSRQLFGAPYSGLLHDFPSQLNQFSERTASVLGPSRELALRHTLLGYFLPWVAPDLSEKIISAVTNGSAPHLKMQLGITASRVGGLHPLKGCLECFDEDERQFGRAYWRVSHQCPSTMVCVKHRTALYVVRHDNTPVHRRGWILPRSGLAKDWSAVEIGNSTQLAILIRLAQFSAHAIQSAPASFTPDRLASTYQLALEAKGALTRGGSLRSPQLDALVQATYEGLQGLRGFTAFQAIASPASNAAASLSRRRPRKGHPFKHLLLITMLFESWEEFQSHYVDAEVATDRRSKIEPTNGAQPHLTADRDLFLRLMREQGLSATAAAQQVGITTTTGITWAKAHGLTVSSRPKSLNAKLLKQVRAFLVRGIDKQEITKKTGISETSLNRLIVSEPEVAQAWRSARLQKSRDLHRTNFLSLLQTHKGVPIKVLRKIPGNGYAWLYRNDRPWLEQVLPFIEPRR